jgi:hypothetical protein
MGSMSPFIRVETELLRNIRVVLALFCGGCSLAHEGTGSSGASASAAQPTSLTAGGPAKGAAANSGVTGRAGVGGGAAGRTSNEGNAVERCNADALAATGGMLGKACISCACGADPKALETCSKTTKCWQLIGCVQTLCAGMTANALTNCALSKCLSSADGTSTAQAAAAYAVFAGTCSTTCFNAGNVGM